MSPRRAAGERGNLISLHVLRPLPRTEAMKVSFIANEGGTTGSLRPLEDGRFFVFGKHKEESL